MLMDVRPLHKQYGGLLTMASRMTYRPLGVINMIHDTRITLSFKKEISYIYYRSIGKPNEGLVLLEYYRHNYYYCCSSENKSLLGIGAELAIYKYGAGVIICSGHPVPCRE